MARNNPENPIELSYARAVGEVVANASQNALHDKTAFETLINNNSSEFAKTLRKWIDHLIQTIKKALESVKRNSAEYNALLALDADMKELQRLFNEGLIGEESAFGNEILVENVAEIKYSYKGKNKNGIEVYETSKETKSLSYKERMAKFLDIMINQYMGRTAKLTRNGHAYYATFEESDVRKNIYGDTRSDKKGQAAKIKVGADGNIFELVENSKYNGSKQEVGKNAKVHKGIKYWDYFVKTVQIDGQVFDLVANVRKTDSNQYTYSIQLNKNKKIEAAPSLNDIKNAAFNRMLTTSDITVSQSEQRVKSIIRENTQNDTHKSSKSEKKLSVRETMQDSSGKELTPEQAEFFKDSKAVNRKGELLVMYHYTNNEFTVFDTSKSGINQGKTHGDGIYMSTSRTAYADPAYGTRAMLLYADITNPFNMNLSEKEADFVLNKYASKKHDLDSCGGVYRSHAFSKLTDDYRVMDYLLEYADDNGIGVSDILKDLGYDGVRDGILWVAFDLSQVKSTDNLNPSGNEDIRYSYREGTTDKDIDNNIKFVANMDSVAELTGHEFIKGEIDLVSQVDEYFSTFDYSVENSVLGNVDITARGAKDSISHGIGRNKAIAFAAVPQVIRHGKIIDFQRNWKNRGYDTITLAAPITIENHQYYEGVIIKRNSNTQRLYVHEVITERRTDMPFKTGAVQKNGKSGGTSSPSLISLLNKIRIVKENSESKKKFSVREPMQDSNGKELTPEQAEFFKDSKVVDEDGNLLVVYHGTNAEFTVFDKSKYNSNENEGDYVGEGFFFSKNSSTANKYGKNIVSAYINIENPLIIDTEKDAKDFGQTFLRMYKNGDSDLRKLLGGMYDYFEIANENPALIRGELIRRGYDGLIDNLYNQYAVFDSNQIKSTDNLNPTDSEDIRYSYRESFGKGDEYLYENLIKKPPINIVKLTTNAPITENGKINRKKLVDTAIENVIAFGKLNKNGNAVINNYDTGNDIIVSKKSLQHGLDRRVEPQAQVLSHIGEVLQYSIVVNELSPKNDSIDNTYILLGMARSKDKELYIISSLVNSYTNEAEAVDVLYSVNTKKESAALLPELQSNDLQSPTDSKISISSFLEIVNEYFPDVLPTDVLKHFGHDKRPSSKIGESALYSYREFKGTPEQASREQLEKTLAVLEEQFKLTHGERIDRKALRGFIKDLTKRYPLLSTFFDLHLTCTLTCLYVFLYAFICAVKKSKNPETLYRKHYQEFSPAKTKGVVWCG